MLKNELDQTSNTNIKKISEKSSEANSMWGRVGQSEEQSNYLGSVSVPESLNNF